MNYREYLSSPEWATLSRKAYERANHLCEFCRAPAKNIHHVQYPKQYEDDTLHNLVAVCLRCHSLSHGMRDVEDGMRAEHRSFKAGYDAGYDHGFEQAFDERKRRELEVREFKQQRLAAKEARISAASQFQDEPIISLLPIKRKIRSSGPS